MSSMTRLFVFYFCILCLGPQANASDAHDAASPADLAERGEWVELSKQLDLDSKSAQTVQADGATALHWAAVHGNAKAAAELVRAGAEVNCLNEYSVSPLSLACEYGSVDVAKILLTSGADANAARLGKETPLMFAALSGNAELARLLIKHEAKVDAKEARQQTALMWAAASGNDAVVKVLVEAGAELDYRLPRSDFSAIMFAARHGHTECVMALLDAGLDVNDTMTPQKTGGRNPRKGMSPLLLAVESGHLELALKLIRRGADPNDRRSGFAPMHAITWVRKTERGDNPEGDPAPRITGLVDTLEFVRELARLGANVNLRAKRVGRQGQRLYREDATPFLLASRGADLPLMKLLLELGADPTLTNADGTNALMAAAGVGVIAVGEEPGSPEEVDEAVRMLFDLGLDIDTVDKKGNTAMHGAALRTFPNTVRVLAKLGADPAIWNKKNDRGWTPFDIGRGKRPGSVKPSPETVKALKEALAES